MADLVLVHSHAELLTDEIAALTECEEGMRQCSGNMVRDFGRYGELLGRIRKEGLYLARDPTLTWDAYCQQEWGFNGNRGRQIIRASQAVEKSGNLLPLFSTGGDREIERLARQAERLNAQTETCTVDDLQRLIDQGLRFGTLYVDPPWCYGNQATRSATDNHYETLTLEEIAALPVSELAADECHLHMWTTNAFLHDSFHLLADWGFEFKSLLVWDKDKFGIGNYWRLQTEYLLLGTKGGLTFLDHSQPNIVRGSRAKHSAKPDAVRRMIEKVSPGPRLEMFARRISNGWVAWGNEIERTMFDADVKEVA